MKKILALIFTLVAVFSVSTACAPVDNGELGSGESGGQESVVPGESTGGSSGDTVVPPITDGGSFDGGDY